MPLNGSREFDMSQYPFIESRFNEPPALAVFSGQEI